MKTQLLALCLAATLTGCTTTHYRSVTREPNGIVTERDLKATTFAVKRDLGPVKLGADSLGGSNSDGLQAASEALSLAAAALKR